MLRSVLTNDEGVTWPRSDAHVRWGVGAAVACFFAAQLLATLWVGATINPLFGDEGLPPLDERPLWALPVLSVGLWVGYLFGPGLINRLTNSGPMVDFDLRINRNQFVAAAMLGIVVQLLVLPPLYWVIGLVVDADPGATATSLVDRADDPLSIALLVFSVVVMAPLAEEWFYRGMLLSALVRRIGAVGGAVGSSVVFAVIHLEPILYPGLFVFALVLAWLTLRTGRLGVAIVAHLAFNATTVVQLLVFG
ncbi:MAG: type II CAAX endopeptidase family protein [Actinomycetota bacterium]